MHQRPRILFVTYGGGHVNLVLPIIRELTSRGGYDIHVLGLTTAAPVLRKAGIPFFGFRELLSKDDTHAVSWGKSLGAKLEGGLVEKEETEAYLGLSYVDLEQRHGAEAAAEMYAKQGRQVFFPLTVMERLFNKISPDLLVATNSPRSERAAFTTAKELGIPSLCICDQFPNPWEIHWMSKEWYGKKVCVFSESIKKSLVDEGRRADEIVVTGNPAFDDLVRDDLAPQASEWRLKNGGKHARVILWASQPEPSAHLETGAQSDPNLPQTIEQELFRLVKKHPDWLLVIRFHPCENRAYTTLPERVVMSPQHQDLGVLLQAVDLVVSMTSTVGLMGACLGKPFVALNVSIYSADAPYTKMGIARGVEQLKELESGLLDVLDGGWKSTATLPTLGSAAEKVCRIISELAKPE